MRYMKTIILCGGMGTRLREETEHRPKPLVEIGGKPILWHIMKIYAHYGFKDFALCLGYKGNLIKQYFLEYETMNRNFEIELGTNKIQFYGKHDEQDFHVSLIDTGLETMTGGRIKRMKPYITDDIFMVTYGDSVADIDITKLLQFHESHGCAATITVVKPTSRFGVLQIDEKNKVTKFDEKPTLEGSINAGFYVFNRKVFDYLSDDTCVLERTPLMNLAKDGELCAYHHPGTFNAMDTYRDYLELNNLWNSNKAKWKIW